jgi:hypothetical protein
MATGSVDGVILIGRSPLASTMPTKITPPKLDKLRFDLLCDLAHPRQKLFHCGS